MDIDKSWKGLANDAIVNKGKGKDYKRKHILVWVIYFRNRGNSDYPTCIIPT